MIDETTREARIETLIEKLDGLDLSDEDLELTEFAARSLLWRRKDARRDASRARVAALLPRVRRVLKGWTSRVEVKETDWVIAITAKSGKTHRAWYTNHQAFLAVKELILADADLAPLVKEGSASLSITPAA